MRELQLRGVHIGQERAGKIFGIYEVKGGS